MVQTPIWVGALINSTGGRLLHLKQAMAELGESAASLCQRQAAFLHMQSQKMKTFESFNDTDKYIGKQSA